MKRSVDADPDHPPSPRHCASLRPGVECIHHDQAIHCRRSRRNSWRKSSPSPSPPASAAATSRSGAWPSSASRSWPASSARCCRSSTRTTSGCRPAGSRWPRLIYAIWNAINDPLFGYITDSTRSQRGRRIPYMRFTAPFLGLTFILVWLAPQGAGAERALLLDAGRHAAVRHLLHHHRPGLLGAAARGDRVGQRAAPAAGVLLAVRPGRHAAGLHHPRLVPAEGRRCASDVSFLPLQAAMVVVAIVCVALLLLYTLQVRERPEFTRVDKPLPARPLRSAIPSPAGLSSCWSRPTSWRS